MLPLFSPQFRGIQLVVVTVLSHRCNSCTDARLRAMRPLKPNPTKLHCFFTQCPSNPESSHPNVAEETPYTWLPCQRAYAQPATGVAGAGWDKEISAFQTFS